MRKNSKERAARRAAWNQAIRESRVVNFGEPLNRFESFRTAKAALDAVEIAQWDGITAIIVNPALAEE